MNNTLRRGATAAFALALMAGVAGCGTGSKTADTGDRSSGGLAVSDVVAGVKVDQNARDALPDDIVKGGVLEAGGETDLPPYLYREGGRITGIEADFMAALGKTLGVKVHITNTTFDSMVIGLTSGRFDIAMSDFSDTLEREQQVDFVDYTKTGQQLIVAKGNPKDIHTVKDLCGNSAAGPTGSLSVQLSKEQSKKCVETGKEPVDVQDYKTAAATQLALENGRTDALGTDYAIASYQVSQSPDKLQLTGGLFELGYHGAAVPKGDHELASALKRAFTSMMERGVYTKILKKWGVPQMAMDKVVINAMKKSGSPS
ncbi:MAG: ABC transporter substrate-binding protein [Nocardioidaceae bacterium]